MQPDPLLLLHEDLQFLTAIPWGHVVESPADSLAGYSFLDEDPTP